MTMDVRVGGRYHRGWCSLGSFSLKDKDKAPWIEGV